MCCWCVTKHTLNSSWLHKLNIIALHLQSLLKLPSNVQKISYHQITDFFFLKSDHAKTTADMGILYHKTISTLIMPASLALRVSSSIRNQFSCTYSFKNQRKNCYLWIYMFIKEILEKSRGTIFFFPSNFHNPLFGIFTECQSVGENMPLWYNIMIVH